MKLRITILALLCLITVGCSPIENQARDSAAAIKGAIESGQAKYQASCTANPSQSVCQLINRGISAQNALVTSAEAYCGWAVGAPPSDPLAKCVPVKSAQAALQSAILNANQITLEIKGAL